MLKQTELAYGRGVLIVLEGPDGSGKTTQAKLLADDLDCCLLRTVSNSLVRELVLEPKHGFDDLARLMLFAADMRKVSLDIKAKLAAGQTVVCDRFVMSMYVYQHCLKGLPLSLVDQLAELATAGLKPDVTVWLNMSTEDRLRRIDSRGEARDEFEADEAQAKVSLAYSKLMAADCTSMSVLATGSEWQVHTRLSTQLMQRLRSLTNGKAKAMEATA